MPGSNDCTGRGTRYKSCQVEVPVDPPGTSEDLQSRSSFDQMANDSVQSDTWGVLNAGNVPLLLCPDGSELLLQKRHPHGNCSR